MQLHDAQGKRLYLTADERLAFMAAAARAARPVRTLCAVLHTTGCRISEALALTPEHVDLPGKAVGGDLGSRDGQVVLDFNFAYNPSCSYSDQWICPLAPAAKLAAAAGHRRRTARHDELPDRRR